jgi:hypothetical protein
LITGIQKLENSEIGPIAGAEADALVQRVCVSESKDRDVDTGSSEFLNREHYMLVLSILIIKIVFVIIFI